MKMPPVESKKEQAPQSTGPSRRRQQLVLGLGAAAACAGGMAWRQLAGSGSTSGTQPPSSGQVQSGPARAHGPSAGSGPDLQSLLWQQTWASPSGAAIKPAAWRGQALLLNFWATWCPPCLREMPLLEHFYKQNAAKNWQMLGLAADKAEAVVKYLSATPVSYPIALLGLEGIELGQQLGNSAGGLPFTLWIDKTGQLRDRHVGELNPGVLDNWALAAQTR